MEKNFSWVSWDQFSSGGVRPRRVEKNWASYTAVTGSSGRKRPSTAAMAPVSVAWRAAAA